MGSCFICVIYIWTSKQLTTKENCIYQEKTSSPAKDYDPLPLLTEEGDAETARNINISNGFPFSITAKTLTGLYMWVTRRVSYKKRKLNSPRFVLAGSVLLIFLVFLRCPIMCLSVLSSVLCPLRFLHKNDARFVLTPSCRRTHVMFTLCWVRLYLQL